MPVKVVSRKQEKQSNLSDLQRKFQTANQEMNDALIERSGEIDLVQTALICNENPLLVGPPGTAKSFLANALVDWMGKGVEKYSILLTKHTTPDELFGPLSLQALKNGYYKRVITHKMPEAHVAFIDEVFKASSAILNTMLRILNERQFDNGDASPLDCPLRICVSASNEWPNDQEGGRELNAVFDRFLLRKKVRPIATRQGQLALLWGGDHTPNFSESISLKELSGATNDAMSLDFTEESKEALHAILSELNKEGIFPGDRRKYKSIKAAKAFAWLRGGDEVLPEHLEILSHCLWDDPQEQPEKCAKVVMKIANPLGMVVTEKLIVVEEILQNVALGTSNSIEGVIKLQAVQKELSNLKDDSRKNKALRYISTELKRLNRSIVGAPEEEE